MRNGRERRCELDDKFEDDSRRGFLHGQVFALSPARAATLGLGKKFLGAGTSSTSNITTT